MKCGKCGSELLDDSAFCMICGNNVGDEHQVVSYADLPFGTIVVCPKCGAKNSRTDRWCGACDADLEVVKVAKTMAPPKGPVCPKCGDRNYENANYCRRCGTSFIVTERTFDEDGPEVQHQHEIIRERQVIMIRCRYCGTLNGPSVQKCSSCGAQM
jgi:uncharacterized OB-fold protein